MTCIKGNRRGVRLIGCRQSVPAATDDVGLSSFRISFSSGQQRLFLHDVTQIDVPGKQRFPILLTLAQGDSVQNRPQVINLIESIQFPILSQSEQDARNHGTLIGMENSQLPDPIEKGLVKRSARLLSGVAW